MKLCFIDSGFASIYKQGGIGFPIPPIIKAYAVVLPDIVVYPL